VVFKTIVVATDGSDSGDQALAAAKALATESKGRLVVVYVDELVPGRLGAQHARVLEHDLQHKVRTQVAELNAGGLSAELKEHQVAMGGPAQAIAKEAKAASADLIVAGSRGRGTLRGLLLGSVTHRLLQIATCAVLVIPKATAKPSQR
jgi:nucleotide-binding universal stress UspA family protein